MENVALFHDLGPLEEKGVSLKKSVYQAFPYFCWVASDSAV